MVATRLAPVVLFYYNRPEKVELVLKALSANFLAPHTELYIYSDGPKSEADFDKVNQVRSIIRKQTGFKKVTIIERPANIGLANSVISGVSEVLKTYERVIVLEDDLITAPNFLNFMNQCLDFYAEKEQILSISGFTLDLPSLKRIHSDCYFGYRASSWGWGTWRDRWSKVDWSYMVTFSFWFNIPALLRLSRGGSDMPIMLLRQKLNLINSWAIRFCLYQSMYGHYTVFPKRSLVYSIGVDEAATHNKKTRRFYTTLDTRNKTSFQLSEKIEIDKAISREFRNQFSVWKRLMDRC